MKIRKAIVAAKERMDIIELEMPALGPKDILLKTVSVGLCHTDLPTFLGTQSGEMTERGYVRMLNYAVFPADTGHEPVAQVVDVGREVTRYQCGDYVAGMGGGKYGQFNAGAFSDYLIIDEDERQFVKLPGDMDRPYECCLAEPLECIVNMVRETRCRMGDNVAVLGCGFMGLMTIAGLRKSGARHITAVDLVDNRLALAKKYGATETINPRNEKVDDAAYDITSGRFYDSVVEITGSMKGLETAAAIIRPAQRESLRAFDGSYMGNGRIVMASVYTKNEPFTIPLAYNLVARAPDIAVVMPDYVCSPRRNMEIAVQAYADGTFQADELITHRFRFEDIQSAFEALSAGKPDMIKGMVVFD